MLKLMQVTYVMHIILRYEIERGLMAGSIKVAVGCVDTAKSNMTVTWTAPLKACVPAPGAASLTTQRVLRCFEPFDSNDGCCAA